MHLSAPSAGEHNNYMAALDCCNVPMVPGGQGCLATRPCRVLGQVMEESVTGLQNSTAMLGRTEDGSERAVTSGRAAGCRSVVVLRGAAGVVEGDRELLVVVVLVEAAVGVTVTGRVVVRVVVVSIKTFPEEGVSGSRR